MHVTRTFGLLAAALSTLLVTACGTAAPPSSPAASSPESATVVAAGHNEADITFVQGMIPHHEQAVVMSQLAADRAASPRVKELAATIEQAQAPEIEQMRGFLEAWGVEEDSSMGGMDHGSMGQGGMPGMMSGQQMGGLDRANGAGFDRMFLQMMVVHHEGAVTMARTELADGQNPQAKALAQAIIDQQTAEIAQMQELLKTV
ncbi:DUF305 domain-containing protein [Pseudonocardia sp.]|uniref:DUF305 domain-containing protein n=1 Tax=Pseudonocardia sp. TaxID=60912 RepID=UPI003D12AC44